LIGRQVIVVVNFAPTKPAVSGGKLF